MVCAEASALTVKPRAFSAAIMSSVSSLKSAPVRVTGASQRAASRRARLVRLLEPGRVTSPRTGWVKGWIGSWAGSGMENRGACGQPRAGFQPAVCRSGFKTVAPGFAGDEPGADVLPILGGEDVAQGLDLGEAAVEGAD